MGLQERFLATYPRLRLQAGQALVELLVAMSISALMLPALATAMIATREGKAQQDKRLQATALLREANEAVRIVRQTGWTGLGTNGTYRPTIAANSWTLTSGAETIGNFTRSIVISDVQRNTSTGAIVTSGGVVDPSTKQVVSTVSWTLPVADSVTTTSYYQRYLNNNTWTQTTQAEFTAGTKTNTVATATGGGQLELATISGPAQVQTTGSFADASATTIAQAFSSAVKGGNLIVAVISWDTAASTTVTCSDNQGNTYTNATNANDTSNTQALAICYAPNIAGGATTVTATFGAASVTRRIVVHEYSGLATASPVDVTRTNIANGTTAADNITSLAATTTVAGDLIFGVVMEDDAGTTTISAGTNFTQRNIINTELATQDRIQAAAGSIASTQTFGTARRYLAHMVAFKAAGTATDWAPPNIVGSADAAGTEDATDVYTDGTYAYIADATILRVYDVSNPASPTAMGTFTAGGTINGLDVSGNFVYLATSNTAGELTIVDATNKSSLSVEATVNLPSTEIGLAVDVANNHAYIGRAFSSTSGRNEFYIYDVTTPASPIQRGSLSLTAQVNSISVPTTTHAYLATSITTAEVTVIKIDVPATPTSAGTYEASGTSIGSDILAIGNTVYLAKANNTSGAEFFILAANTSVPTAVTFTLSGSYEAAANVNGVYVSGTAAFLATAITNAQLRVLNITTPASITVTGSLNLAAVGNDIWFGGGVVCLATAHDTRELTIVQPLPTPGASGYQTSGTMDSTSFDATASAGYNYFTFTITEPAGTDVRIQFASNNDNATWNYLGPDGTTGTFYSAAGTIRITTVGRYLRYRATLTGPGTSTPVLSDITVNYSP